MSYTWYIEQRNQSLYQHEDESFRNYEGLCLIKGIRKGEGQGRVKGKIPGNEGGMMTVEVSVILPTLCLLIAGAVFFVLFLLDMSVVKSETQRIVAEAAAVWKTEGRLADGEYSLQRLAQRPLTKILIRNNEDLLGQAETRLRTRIMARTCLVKRVETNVHIRGDCVCGTCQLFFAIPLSGIAEYLLRDSWSYHCRSRAQIDGVQEMLRASHVVNRRRKRNGE